MCVWIGSHVVQIVGCDVITAANYDIDFHFRYRVQGGGKHDGVEFTDVVPMVNSGGSIDLSSQTYFDIRKASGVMDPQDEADFVGKVLCANVTKGGRIKYGAEAQP